MARQRQRHGAKRQQLRVERLEPRVMLASDMTVAIELAILNLDGDPVSQVEIGDEFILQASARDLREATSPYGGVFAAYVDVNYGANWVQPIGAIRVTDAFPSGISGDASTSGVIDEVGGFRQIQGSVVDTSEEVFFEMSFIAEAPGEVLFAANPAEEFPLHDILLLGSDFEVLPQWVDYGFVRLQIGDPIANPPSPWRNPGNPFDVNNNGVVTIADAELIDEEITANGEHELPATDDVNGLPPYFDVTGDGFVANDDALAIRSQFAAARDVPRPVEPGNCDGSGVPRETLEELFASLPVPPPGLEGAALSEWIDGLQIDFGAILRSHELINGSHACAKSRILRDLEALLPQPEETDLGVRLDVVNTRTGNSGSTVKVGDVLNVRGYLTGLEVVAGDPILLVRRTTSAMRLAYDPDQFSVFQVPGDVDAGHGMLFDLQLVAKQAGNATISTQFGDELSSERLLLFRFDQYGNGFIPLDAVEFLDEAIADGTTTVDVSANHIRPQVIDDSFVFEASVPLEISAAAGLLSNDLGALHETARVQLVGFPSKGIVTLRQDGSFAYHPRSSFDGTDRFEYVVITDEGTSDLATATITGELPPLVDILVRPVDAEGQPITSAKIGEQFYLQGLVADLRGAFAEELRGVFAADIQVGFEPDLVASTGDVIINPTFDAFSFAETSVGSGLISVSGHSGFTATGLGEHEVFRVPMQATAVGEPHFTITNVGEVNLMRFGTVRDNLINLHDATLTIGADSRWQNPANPLDTDDDGAVAPVDALLGINLLNSRGPVALADRDMMLSGKAVYLDSNGDRYHSSIDVLGVINRLNAVHRLQAEGEQAPASSLIAVSPPQQTTIAPDEPRADTRAEGVRESAQAELKSEPSVPFGDPQTATRQPRPERSVARPVDEELLDCLARGIHANPLETRESA